MTRTRVLALDGGGLRGVFTAALLAHVEAELGVPLIEHFDLVTGTSTGSIIALGLVSGMSAKDILQAYKTAGPIIFRKRASLLSRMGKPGHSNEALKRWLNEFFGDKRLKESLRPVVVATFDAATGQPRVWKTDHHPELHGGGSRLMREVALASSAAPTYLPGVQIDGGGAYLDGGLWANNPSVMGIVEAHRYLGAPLDDIVMLSIGTGRRPTWYRFQDIVRRGILGWGGDIIETVFAAQSSSAHNQARLLLKEHHYLRVDVDLARNIPLDDPTEIPDLVHLGRSKGSESLQQIKRLLGPARNAAPASP
jgi:patatin-like phospholipase/acyl hydrolase